MAEATLAWRTGEGLLGQGRAKEAEAVFRKLLARMEAGAAFDAGYRRCVVLSSLGRSLGAQGRAGEAEAIYRRELAALAALAQDDGVRRQTGIVDTDLADVLAAQGRYAEARAKYEAALEIAKRRTDESADRRRLSAVGHTRAEAGELAEARRRYLEALALFRADKPRE